MTAKKKPQHRGNGTGVTNEIRMRTEFHAPASSGQAQRQRIIEALRRRGQTTEDLRTIGIFQVPARVKELRDRFGYDIETVRVTVVDRESYSHPRAALYVLHEPKGAV
ncbi:helix-turn-helix domain-containing protein [Variovorax sp. dw_308]|uniref:helix-turn-helix domain-containing protein n=1 Tax=Variovorax sp. dw_308 TaxID=2721546 RepID=UPI001C45FA2E|nr:helix-turn-helix domain-containing protein [Variovorax sp. dw_308]